MVEQLNNRDMTAEDLKTMLQWSRDHNMMDRPFLEVYNAMLDETAEYFDAK